MPPPPVSCTGVIATPTVALTTTQPVLTGGAIVTEQVAVPTLPALSLIVTVYWNVPETVGVPEIVPFDDIVKPAGSPVALKV